MGNLGHQRLTPAVVHLKAPANQGRNVSASAATSDTQEHPSSGGSNVCCVCGGGPLGMGQHMKRAHPEEHCKSKEPSTVRSNARWTVEEMALVVRELNSMESNLTAIKKIVDWRRLSLEEPSIASTA